MIAFIYSFNNFTSTWNLNASLTSPAGGSHDNFGTSVSIYNNTVVIGASTVGSHEHGEVYIYHYNNNTFQWELFTTLHSIGGDYTYFGSSVQIYENKLIIGAPDQLPNLFTNGPGKL